MAHTFIPLVLMYLLPLCTGQLSCRNRCGESYHRGNRCHCDYSCVVHSECCGDYESSCTTGDSCKGRCGESFKRGRQCHCDAKCTQYNQCCPDYVGNCGKVESADAGSTPSPKNDEGYEPPKPNTPRTDLTLESTAVPQSSEQYLQDASGVDSGSVPRDGDGSLQEHQSASSPETTTLSSDRGVTAISATGNPAARTTAAPADEPSDPETFTKENDPDVNMSSGGGENSPSAEPSGQVPEGIEEVTPDPALGSGSFVFTEKPTDADTQRSDTRGSDTPSSEKSVAGTAPADQKLDETNSEDPANGTLSQMESLHNPDSISSKDGNLAPLSSDDTHNPETTPSNEKASPTPQQPTTPGSSVPNASPDTVNISSDESNDTSPTETPPAEVESQTEPVLSVDASTPRPERPAADQPATADVEHQDGRGDSGDPSTVAVDPVAFTGKPSKPEMQTIGTEAPKTDDPTDSEHLADNSNGTDLCDGQPISGLTTLRNGTIAVFRGHYFWMLDDNRVPGPARSIREVWGIPSPIDTVFTRCNCQGKTYFFKGNNYWRFENDVMDPGYPQTISTGFSGLAGKITAALTVPEYGRRSESVFFFKQGGLLQRYGFKYGTSPTCGQRPRYMVVTVRSRHARQAEDGLEREIKITWKGFPTLVTSAISVPTPRKPNGYHHYIFSKTKYYNIKVDGDQPALASPEPSQPQENSAKSWFNCP
ncbi:proteoglycan 4b [Brienomyrus brachyistius]|uniref:proteoglycan 4b n=1 Tax=Brienomyrus brachyistius TaxID=42636 RepID=UPI0020B1A4D5|nr:proteoglycan 4b [Brienomyrus brachyistius]